MLYWNKRAERFRVSGVEVLRCCLTLPQWEEHETLSALYREIGDRAMAFCKDRLREEAEAEYESSEDERKRFRFPTWRYELTGEVCHAEDGLLSVRLTATLCRKGSAEPLMRGYDAHTWQLEEGADAVLLPPEQVAERVTGRALPRRKRRRAKGAVI